MIKALVPKTMAVTTNFQKRCKKRSMTGKAVLAAEEPRTAAACASRTALSAATSRKVRGSSCPCAAASTAADLPVAASSRLAGAHRCWAAEAMAIVPFTNASRNSVSFAASARNADGAQGGFGASSKTSDSTAFSFAVVSKSAGCADCLATESAAAVAFVATSASTCGDGFHVEVAATVALPRAPVMNSIEDMSVSTEGTLPTCGGRVSMRIA
mmetsp:Transcript_54176/g.150731  ORF Transcript_54176/g.150731 Transcript_54176/m.150731 type:complete len:213 (-) Transcript_54176:38-676(-)